jgi:hypothetical protein
MIKRVPLLSLVLLFMPSFTLAQHNCPQGFQYVGNLSGTGSFGNELNEKREINLPENATMMSRTNRPEFGPRVVIPRHTQISFQKTHQKEFTSLPTVRPTLKRDGL